jgi:dolichol-phosphate mannosyltransferase
VADLLVIIPTYNERGNIARVIERTRRAVPDAHILVVDDNSPDGTGQLADDIAAHESAIRVLHREGKDGLGKAYLAGFRIAIDDAYEYVAEMDADGSHDPAELPAMLERARSGADLVIGSRWIPGGAVSNWPRSRQLISRLGNAYARTILRSRVRDITAGFRIYRTAALATMRLESVASHGYGFQVELAWRIERAGGSIIEHPITFVERESGRSKMHIGIVVEALARVTAWGVYTPRSKR